MSLEQISLATSEAPQIHIEVHGNLRLAGWDQAEVVVEARDRETVSLAAENDTVRLEASTSCRVKVPAQARLQVAAIQGNGTFRSLAGDLRIGNIGGNMRLEGAGTVEVDKVYGNLIARQVNGDFEAQAVYGNTNLQDVSGRLSVQEAVKGNLALSNIGGARAAALGNITLSLQPQPGQEFDLEASSNIHLRVPQQTNAEIHLASQSQNILVNLAELSETIQRSTYDLTLGTGDARISLSAKGSIQISGQTEDWEPGGFVEPEIGEGLESITDEINHLINIEMQALEQELSQRLSNLPDFVEPEEFATDIDEIVAQARQYSTRAALRAQTRAQAAAQKAQEKLARKLAKVRRRAERQSQAALRRSRGGRRSVPLGRAPRPRDAADLVTDEERLLILKMLEEKKISLEEAELLLEALEGQGG